MDLKEKLKSIRKENNLTQEQLAESLNVTRQAVAKWELGETIPDISNLILISNKFNISLDRLLKNDTCSDKDILNKELPNKNIEEMISFLCTAKKNTYASSMKDANKPSRPNSKDLVFTQGDLKYFDSYFGAQNFVGEEVLFKNDVPLWAMNYYGVEINDKFSAEFLKSALSNVTKDMPYRGPKIFKEGDYTYTCNVEGNFREFEGKELMYLNQKRE